MFIKTLLYKQYFVISFNKETFNNFCNTKIVIIVICRPHTTKLSNNTFGNIQVLIFFTVTTSHRRHRSRSLPKLVRLGKIVLYYFCNDYYLNDDKLNAIWYWHRPLTIFSTTGKG